MLHAQLNGCASQWQCLSLCVPEDKDGWYVEKPEQQPVSVPVSSLPVEVSTTPEKANPSSPEKTGAWSVEASPEKSDSPQKWSEKFSVLSGAGVGVVNVFCQMGVMWPLSFFSSIGAAMIVPMFPYIATNFFARQYTELSPWDIHCESTPDQSYCVQANAESVSYQCMCSTASALLQVTVGPLLGAVSDSWGRKKVICIICFLQVLAALSFLLNVKGLCNFWVVLFFYPLLGLPFLGTYFTIAIDMVRNPNDRSIAFNLIVIVDAACVLLGLIASAIMDLQHVITYTFACYTILMLYTFFFISETLNPNKRKPFNCWAAVPGLSLMVFFKDKLHRQLGLTFFIGLLYRTGYLAIAPGYLQKYLAFTQAETCMWFLSTQISAIVTMTALMGSVQQCLGDSYTMFLSLAASICVCATMPWLATFKQVAIMCFVLSGLTQFFIPVVSGVVTKITKEREQGTMQGALSAWQGLASAVGPMMMNGLYQVSSELAAKDPQQAKGMPWYCLGIIVTPAALTVLCTSRTLRAATQAQENQASLLASDLSADSGNRRSSALATRMSNASGADLDAGVTANALRRQSVGMRM